MRRLYFLLAFILVALSSPAQIVWLETVHDFGTIDEDQGKVTGEMRFVNTGKTPVVIQNVRVTCGCTVANYTRQSIEEGDTGRVEVTYNPLGRPGKFGKKVIVITDSNPRRTALLVKGKVIGTAQTIRNNYPESLGNLKFKTLIAAFGEISKGNVTTETLAGYNQSRDTMKISFEGLPKYIAAKCYPETISPADYFAVTLFYDSSKQPKWGTVTDTFNIVANKLEDGTKTVKRVDAVALITENFEHLSQKDLENAPVIKIFDDRIDFGQISRNSGIIEQEFSISNNGKNELKIHRIYSLDKAVKCIEPENAKIKKGKSKKFKISIDTSKIDGNLLNAHIMILCNDPKRSPYYMRAVGEIIK